MKITGLTALLTQLCLIYSIKEGKKEAWSDAVIGMLGTYNLDYDGLYRHIISNHNSDFLPNPALLKEMAMPFVKKVDASSKWRQPKVYNPIHKVARSTDCFPAGTTDEQIIRTYEKMFPGTSGWAVVDG